MCSNYTPPEPQTIAAFFNALMPTFSYAASRSWQGAFAPMLLPADARSSGQMRPFLARFRLLPFFADPSKFKAETYNAKAETVAKLASYRRPWQRRQFCLIPVQRFMEPNYEGGGRPRWWAVERADGEPFCLAGIWEKWEPREPEATANGDRGQPSAAIWSFAMLTIDATDHPLMSRFHAPDDPKRSVVVVEKHRHEEWLHAKNDAEARSLLVPFDPGPFRAQPVVEEGSDRKTRAAHQQKEASSDPPAQRSLLE